MISDLLKLRINSNENTSQTYCIHYCADHNLDIIGHQSVWYSLIRNSDLLCPLMNGILRHKK